MSELPQDERLDEAFSEYTRRLDEGQDVDLQQFLDAYPDVAAELQQCLDTAALIERMAGPTVSEISQLISSKSTRDSLSASQTHDRDEADSNLFNTPCQFGRYEILELLGRGAMGAVYLARDEQLDRKVAIKIAAPIEGYTEQYEINLIREAQAAAALRSPHICPVFDAGVHDGVYFISMAYLSGQTLSRRIKQGKLDQRVVCELLVKIARALQVAHQQGVIHRDLKPANIMLDEQGEPSIMDFGLARRRTGDDIRRSKPGEIIGSPAYMSPEQVAGIPTEVRSSADIYSLGVVLYELLTGRLPYQGSVGAVMGKIIMEHPPAPSQITPDVDPRLEDVCLRMMAKQTVNRYANMTEVADAIQAILDNRYDRAVAEGNAAGRSEDTQEFIRPPTSPKPSQRSMNRGYIVSIILSMLALAAAAAVVLYLQLGTSTVKFEISDPSLSVRVDKQQVTVDNDGKPIYIRPGERNTLFIKRDGLEVESSALALRRGQHVTLRVSLVENQISVAATPLVELQRLKAIPTCEKLEVGTSESSLVAFVDETELPRLLSVVTSPAGKPRAKELVFAPGRVDDFENTYWVKSIVVGNPHGARIVFGISEAGSPRVMRTHWAPGVQIAQEAKWERLEFADVPEVNTRGDGCRFSSLYFEFKGSSLSLSVGENGEPRLIRTMRGSAELAVFR